MTNAYEDIKLTTDGMIATITVDRPHLLNAIRYHTMLEIDDALDAIESDESVRVAVLTGAGTKAFVSGGDISIMAKGLEYVQTLSEVPKGQEVCSRIENFPKPVIARINGYALGGGTELALCCDIRIAVESAKMGLPEIKLGIIPGYGGTQRLPRLIGVGRAKELILTGDRITAQQALEYGLVNRVVPMAELNKTVYEFAQKMASYGPVALQMAKAAINNGLQADMRTALQLEARCYSICFATEDRVEGMNAFLEKRKPNFQGR
ncbi:enoyl-CoA hydratase/isomerase family protein [Desulfomonile tiedjei]|uniref:Enoyl-CoA hydratase/carnithine racemase n=1 Tax=Desulfomonile tiedjei (strain ATCC 49306 / DSM 6799 / DCB-1) TaxID=706587 RepID=I4CEM7_DESTA|nr:enoyl-CoA hydratase-related protein [Desulfomonile tiedjei]AFM28018.1 enoyl-CoA hydratase/carnithine racemase [Desulfomonile tiedjei DSM 6799]